MLFEQISRNKRRTILLLIVFFFLLSLIGAASGYLIIGSIQLGIVLSLIIGFIYAVSMIFQSTNVVMSMNNAIEIKENQAPEYYHIVEDMAMVAQLPMPRVFIIEDSSMNAFATGSSPDNAAVAATTGILKAMNREELEAVIGHEISHIRNYDIRISTIAVALSSAIAIISSFGTRMMWYGGNNRRRDSRDDNSFSVLVLVFSLISIILAPLVATLIQLAISREREYLADASSVELTRNPLGMIHALEKLQTSHPMEHPIDEASAALYISNPLKSNGFKSLFSTHPALEDRIARLKQM